MSCNKTFIACGNCRTCNKVVKSKGLTVMGQNMVIAIPSNNYINHSEMCICLVQNIPATATSTMPVMIQIGVSPTLYPMKTTRGHFIYADQLRTRSMYKVHTAADTSVFTYIGNKCLPCTEHVFAPSIPATPVIITREASKAGGTLPEDIIAKA